MNELLVKVVGVLMSLAVMASFGIIVGLLANRKNRPALAWGIFGALGFFPALLLLIFASFLCPKCKRALTNHEWKIRTCSTCGKLA
ncbi:MAG: hypothetical protein QGD94_00890 [Planctomycetia bacterium]|nr:hypothetical protein [Planctomycetia bacterium]